MTLRTRIVLALLVITGVLVAPAVYALTSLSTLENIASDLRTGQAASLRHLGQLRTSLVAAENQQRSYFVLGLGMDPQRAQALQRVEAHRRDLEQALADLTAADHAAATTRAQGEWARVNRAIERERELIEAGEGAAAEAFRFDEVNEAFFAMNAALEPIGTAIEQAGQRQVESAERVAARAATIVFVAVGIALLLALLIAAVLTRSLLRPIDELRQAMAVVAGGDFNPQVAISPNRKDELGDLARSFERMTEQLAELDRLKAEFISIASHELKTPLSVIRGYVSLLLEGIYGEIAPEQRKPLASVIDQTDRLGRLVQQLLDISRFEAGGGRLDLRPVDLREFLSGLANSFDALALQNATRFTVEVAETLPATIIADPERLNEVVGNLLSNAFKFTPRGGEIRLRAAATDGRVVFEVADTGIGVPADKLPRIFEKFFQVENEAQPRSVGSGLGLAIAREIVEAHGGTITADSQLGRGTTFRVLLPQTPPVAND